METTFTPLAGLVGGALIGLASAGLLLANGRIAGVSGILGGSLFAGAVERTWRLAFLIGTLPGLASFRPASLKLRVDGVELFRGEVALAAVANGRYFGGGMHVAPEARPDDVDPVVRAIERRPHQLRHPGVDDGELRDVIQSVD